MPAFVTVYQRLLLLVLLGGALLQRWRRTLSQRLRWCCCCCESGAARVRLTAAAVQQQREQHYLSAFLRLCGFSGRLVATFLFSSAATGRGASEARPNVAISALPRRCLITCGLLPSHNRRGTGFVRRAFLLLSCAYVAIAEAATNGAAGTNTLRESAPLLAAAAAAAVRPAAAVGRACWAQEGSCVNSVVHLAQPSAAAAGGPTFAACCSPLSVPLLPLCSGASANVRSASARRGKQRALLCTLLRQQQRQQQLRQQKKDKDHQLQWQKQSWTWLRRQPPRQRHPRQKERLKQEQENLQGQQLEHKEELHQQEDHEEGRRRQKRQPQQEKETAAHAQQRRQSSGAAAVCWPYCLTRAGVPLSVLPHQRRSSSCCWASLCQWPCSNVGRHPSRGCERHSDCPPVEKKCATRLHAQMRRQVIAQQHRRSGSRSSNYNNSNSTGCSRGTTCDPVGKCSIRVRSGCRYTRTDRGSCVTRSSSMSSEAFTKSECRKVSSSSRSRGSTTVGGIGTSSTESMRRSGDAMGFLECGTLFTKTVCFSTSKGRGRSSSRSCGVSLSVSSRQALVSGLDIFAAARGESAASSSGTCLLWSKSSYPAAVSPLAQDTATLGEAASCFNWEEYCFTLLCIYGRLAEHAGLHSWGIVSHPRVDYRQQQSHHPPSSRRDQPRGGLRQQQQQQQQQQREGQMWGSRACLVCSAPLPSASAPAADEELFLHTLVCSGESSSSSSKRKTAAVLRDTARAVTTSALLEAAAALPERGSSASGCPRYGGNGHSSSHPLMSAPKACDHHAKTAAAAPLQDETAGAAVQNEDPAAAAAASTSGRMLQQVQQRHSAREGPSYVRAPWYRLLKLKLLLVEYLRFQYAGAVVSPATTPAEAQLCDQRRETYERRQPSGAATASLLSCAYAFQSSGGEELREKRLEQHEDADERQPQRGQQENCGERLQLQQQDWQQQRGLQQQQQWEELDQPRQREKHQTEECRPHETLLQSQLSSQQQFGPFSAAYDAEQQQRETRSEKQQQTDRGPTRDVSSAADCRQDDFYLRSVAASPPGACERNERAVSSLRQQFYVSTAPSPPPPFPSSSSCRPPSPSSFASFLSLPSSSALPSEASSPPSQSSPGASSAASPTPASVFSDDCLLGRLIGRGALQRSLPFHLLPAAVVREAAHLVAVDDARMTMQEAVQLLCFRAQQQEVELLQKQQRHAGALWGSATEKHVQQNASFSAARTSTTAEASQNAAPAAAAANTGDAAAAITTAAAAAPTRNTAAPAAADAGAAAAAPSTATASAAAVAGRPLLLHDPVGAATVGTTNEKPYCGDRTPEARAAAAAAVAYEAAASAGRQDDVQHEAKQKMSTALHSHMGKNWPASSQDSFASAAASANVADTAQTRRSRSSVDAAGWHISSGAADTLRPRTESTYQEKNRCCWPPAGKTAAAAPVGLLHHAPTPKRDVGREAWRAELALLQRLQQVQLTQQDWLVLLPLLPFQFPFEAFEAKATQEELLQFYSELPRRPSTKSRRPSSNSGNSSSNSVEGSSRDTNSSSNNGRPHTGCRGSIIDTGTHVSSSARSSSDSSSHGWSSGSLSSNKSAPAFHIGGDSLVTNATSAAVLVGHHSLTSPAEPRYSPAAVAAAAAAGRPFSLSDRCGRVFGKEEVATTGSAEIPASTSSEVLVEAAVSNQQVRDVEDNRGCSGGGEPPQDRHSESGAAIDTSAAAAFPPVPPQRQSRPPIFAGEAAITASPPTLARRQKECRRGIGRLDESAADSPQASRSASTAASQQRQATDVHEEENSDPVAAAAPACSGGNTHAGDAMEELQQQQQEQEGLSHLKKEEGERRGESKQQRKAAAAARLSYKEGRTTAVAGGRQRSSWPPLPLLRLFAQLVMVLQRRQRERLTRAEPLLQQQQLKEVTEEHLQTLPAMEKRDKHDASTPGREEPEGLRLEEREQVEQLFVEQRKRRGASWQETWIRLLNAAVQQHPFESRAARTAAEDVFVWLAKQSDDNGSETTEDIGEEVRKDRDVEYLSVETGCVQGEEPAGEKKCCLRVQTNQGGDDQEADTAAARGVRTEEEGAGDRMRKRRQETATSTRRQEKVERDADRTERDGEELPGAAREQNTGGHVYDEGNSTHRNGVEATVLLFQTQGDGRHSGRESGQAEEEEEREVSGKGAEGDSRRSVAAEAHVLGEEGCAPRQEKGRHDPPKSEGLRESNKDVQGGEEGKQMRGETSPTREANEGSRAFLEEKRDEIRREEDGKAARKGDKDEGGGVSQGESEMAEARAEAASQTRMLSNETGMQRTEETQRSPQRVVTFASIQEAVLHAVEGEEERSLPWLEFLFEVSKGRRRFR